ncbi:AsmA family protein [Cedecea sp. P7760]|uniref:AsmA family protein n=1 Tax=Cedecea sp. P7760 TaxID=2726983 RepID=UPI0015A19184|nr:AsmA family protein [Cedecea sp. P7760]NWC65489.1 AsmA family protein [Cedecea sp. P7760]
MKFLGKLVLILLGLVILALIAFYILLQTRWGAGQISSWVNEKTNYHLSFNEMEHDWSSPTHLMFHNVTFGRSGQPATLVAKNVDIGLSTRQFSQPLYVDTILLQQGTLNLSSNAVPLPLEADKLQLQDMAINSPDSEWNLSAQRVEGGVSPWQPQAGKVLGNKATIAFSAGSLTLNGVNASNVLLQGNLDNEQVTLTTLGADVARGSLTGNAHRNADGSWQVGSLRLNDIRLQTAKSLSDFLAPVTSIPSLTIDRLEITDARLEGKEWAVSDLALSLRNLTLANGGWHSDDGQLSMNASEFINGSLHLQDPIVNVDFAPAAATLRQFSSRWEGGLVRASGQWLREGNQAVMDEVVVGGLEYTLPSNWKALWMETLPDWLNSITVKKFSANRNLIIDIDPAWPFQMTGLDGTATNIQLARDHQWGIWSGNASFNAAAATFNRVDVRRPSLSLTANQSQVAITELSAFAGKGLLEATATVSQTPQRAVSVSLKGQSVPVNVLHAWGWPSLPLEGDGNLQVSVTGQVSANSALKPTVNGSLQATGASGQQIQQTMHNGEVPGA